MGLKRIEHYFLYASDLEKSRHFYESVLGFEVGYRPPFDFDGYWLYLDGSPCVHLGTAGSGNVAYYLGERGRARIQTPAHLTTWPFAERASGNIAPISTATGWNTATAKSRT